MRTEILSPKKLFQKEVRYVIPPFQRPYVWSQDDQWGPLWEDVRNVAEGYLEALERSGNDDVKAESETTPHFLGAVVLRQVSTATKDLEQREVIDGQQRVTTLQLLLDAIQQVCEGLDQPYAKSAGRRLSRLVTNDRELVTDEHHVFKLWPTRSDQEAFRHAMDNGLAINDFTDSLIVQAHEFFQLQDTGMARRGRRVHQEQDRRARGCGHEHASNSRNRLGHPRRPEYDIRNFERTGHSP